METLVYRGSHEMLQAAPHPNGSTSELGLYPDLCHIIMDPVNYQNTTTRSTSNSSTPFNSEKDNNKMGSASAI